MTETGRHAPARWTRGAVRRFAGCCALLAALGGAPSAASAAGGDPASVRVTEVNGRSWQGELEELAEGRLALGGPEGRALSTADLLRIEFAGRAPAVLADGAFVLLDNGDRLVARAERADGVSLRAAWPRPGGRPPLDVPLETVRAVVVDLPEGEAAARLLTALLGHEGREDVVILRNGDRLAGELIAIEGKVLELDGAVGAAEIELDGVRAIAFSPDLVSFPQPAGPRTLVELADGTRITGRNLRLKPPTGNDGAGRLLAFDALFGAALDVPLAEVASLRFLGERVVFLSEREPSAYRFTPYLPGQVTAWDWTRDRNVVGGPLRVGGTEYARGLGMHSRSELTYDLDGQSRAFLAVAGLDDAAGGGGSVIFAVEVDGRRVFTSEPQTGQSAPLAIGPIDLRGKTRLTLIVDFGDFADIQDHANWCDAVLVR